MTVLELRDFLNAVITFNENNKYDKVVIPNNKTCMGGTSYTEIKDTRIGFDWDRGLVFLNPENKMVESK